MSEQNAIDSGVEQVKTCPVCGGSWPATRPICLACGADLAQVAARPAAEQAGRESFDWRWLDSLASEDEEVPSSPGKSEREPSTGPWWKFWH